MTINLTSSQKKRVLQTIDHDLDHCKLWAQYHHALAITGMTVNRKVFHGKTGDQEWTDDEKIMDSLNTMKAHITRHAELNALKKKLLYEEECPQYTKLRSV